MSLRVLCTRTHDKFMLGVISRKHFVSAEEDVYFLLSENKNSAFRRVSIFALAARSTAKCAVHLYSSRNY